MDRRRILAVVLATPIVVGAALALLTHRLGADSLRGDESIYARVVHETRAAGPWLPLRLYGAVYMNKPPLGFFAIRAAFAALGEDERAARFPAALAGAATAGLLFAYGALRFGFAPALHAAAFYVTAPISLGHHALRGGTFDAATALLALAALIAYAESLRPGRERLFRWTVALVALATLVKTLTAAVLVAGCVLAVESMRARGQGRSGLRRALGRPALLLGGSLLVLLAWVAALVAFGADGAFERVVLWDLVERNVSRVHDSHTGPWWFYLARVRSDGSWSLLLLLPLAAALLGPWRESEPERRAARTVWATAPIVILLLLSLSASRTQWYGLQLLAPLALALAAGAAAVLDRLPAAGRWLAALLLLAALQPRIAYARARLEAPAREVVLDRLSAALAATPAARLSVRPGLDPFGGVADSAVYRWGEAAANSYYLAVAREVGTVWPPRPGPGECAVVLIESARLAREEPPAPSDVGWRRFDLPPDEGPFTLLDGCGGSVVAALAPR